MRRKLSVLLLLSAVCVLSVFGDVKDYFLFNWSTPIKEIENVLTEYGYQVTEVDDFHVSIMSNRSNGIPYWETYSGNGEFGSVWIERPTAWLTEGDMDPITEHYLSREMEYPILLSSNTFTLVDSGTDFRIWKSDNAIAGSTLIQDQQGHYRVFSFITRNETEDIALINWFLSNLGFAYDINLVSED